MKQCLSEERLIALRYGDGSREEQAHRHSCIECARRYRRLDSDMARIDQALREPAPAPAVYDRRAFPMLAWALLGAAAALLLALTVSWRVGAPAPLAGQRVVAAAGGAEAGKGGASTAEAGRLAESTVEEDAAAPERRLAEAAAGEQAMAAAGVQSDEELGALLSSASEAIFGGADADADGSDQSDAEFAYLQAALDGSLPCTWDALGSSGDCGYEMGDYSSGG